MFDFVACFKKMTKKIVRNIKQDNLETLVLAPFSQSNKTSSLSKLFTSQAFFHSGTYRQALDDFMPLINYDIPEH